MMRASIVGWACRGMSCAEARGAYREGREGQRHSRSQLGQVDLLQGPKRDAARVLLPHARVQCQRRTYARPLRNFDYSAPGSDRAVELAVEGIIGASSGFALRTPFNYYGPSNSWQQMRVVEGLACRCFR